MTGDRIINGIINDHVPKLKIRSGNFLFWFGPELISALKSKESARTKWKKSGRQSDYANYSSFRTKCKVSIRTSHGAYLSKLQDNIKTNIKSFWAFTKSKRQTNSYPTHFEFDGKTASDSRGICDLFSTFFESTYINQSSSDSLHVVSPNTVSLNFFNEQEIAKILLSLDGNKNGGPDGIPNIFLIQTAHHLSKPLALIFNKSVNSGECPLEFKEANIMPVFKKGDTQKITNYRPIALLNSITLVFYPLIHGNISVNQHGFSRGKSTCTNLTEYTHYIANAPYDGFEVHSIYTDFSKAFDSVDHHLLIHKLRAMNIIDPFLKWFESYLAERKVSVVFNGYKSVAFSPPCGVPQGSVLGPLLFNVFINDLADELHSPFLMFADDLKIYRCIKNPSDCDAIQRDLNSLSNWCNINKISLNLEKCNAMSFSNRIVPLSLSYILSNSELSIVNQIRDLGVTFDSKLRFDAHISSITNRVFKMLGFVMRATKDFTNVKCIMLLYNALVKSHLEYCTNVWSPFHDHYIYALERVQRRYTKQLHFELKGTYIDYAARLREFRLP